MKTDALIEALTRENAPVCLARTRTRLARAGVVGGLLAGLVVWMIFGVRQDLADAMGVVLGKSVYCLSAVVATASASCALSAPSADLHRRLAPAATLIGTSFAVAALALALTPPDARVSAWLAGGLPECLHRIPVLATPVAASLVFVARSLSPTRLSLAGAALGGLSGAIGATAYCWFCPVDSLAYTATWYPASMLLCAGVGALCGRWLLRW